MRDQFDAFKASIRGRDKGTSLGRDKGTSLITIQ
jgi:hypothetical protein